MLSLPQSVHRIVKGIYLAKNMKKRARDNVTPASASASSIGNLL
jgi:hypothetical protein